MKYTTIETCAILHRFHDLYIACICDFHTHMETFLHERYLVDNSGLPLNIHFKIPDFSLTFNHFPDPFERPILAIFIHRLFEDFAQIFELADVIFKEKS